LDSIYGKTYQTTKIDPKSETRALTSADWVAGKDLQIYTCFPGCTECSSNCARWDTKKATKCKTCWHLWLPFSQKDANCNWCGSEDKDEQYCGRYADVMATEKQTVEKTAATASEELKAMNVKKSVVINPLKPPLTLASSTEQETELKTWTLKSTVKVTPDDLLPAEYSLDVSTKDIYVDNLPANLGSKPSGTTCVVVPLPSNIKKRPTNGKRFINATYLINATGKFPISDADAARKDVKYIDQYKTQFDLYLINDNVLTYWLWCLLSKENLTVFLNEIRTFLENHPELILANYIKNKWQSGIQKMVNQNYVSIPLGPFCLRPSNQYILQNKNYISAYDKNNISVPKYAQEENNFNSIFSIKSNLKNATYLSNVYNSILSSVKFEGNISEYAFAIDIPAYGYQLFDLVNQQATGYLTESSLCHLVKINDTVENDPHSLFALNKARIIIMFKALDSQLSNSYELITSVTSSFVSFVKKDNYIQFCCNSVNGSVSSDYNLLENKVYIYISKASSELSLNFVLINKSTMRDDNNKNVPFFVLEFQANETKNLPILINKREL
jgi:hypothetical protein